MSVQSWGYTGTVAPNDVWANMQYTLGNRYFVYASADAKVSAVAAGTRQVEIATGFLGGRGILDQVTSPETVTLPTVSSGTQYFMIVARRTWGATQATTFGYVSAGTVSPTTLPDREVTPGVLDEQPLAIVRLSSGSAVPVVVYDLRAVGGNGSYSMAGSTPSGLISYMNFTGTVIRLGATTWTYDIVAGAAQWVPDPLIVNSGPGLGNDLGINQGQTGWATSSDQISRGRKSGHVRTLTVIARRTGSVINIAANGSMASAVLPVLVSASDWKPPHSIVAPCRYWTDGNRSYGGTCYMDTTGLVTMISGSPNTNIGNSGTGPSFQATFTWIEG